jgi:hypothetical protein
VVDAGDDDVVEDAASPELPPQLATRRLTRSKDVIGTIGTNGFVRTGSIM